MAAYEAFEKAAYGVVRYAYDEDRLIDTCARARRVLLLRWV